MNEKILTPFAPNLVESTRSIGYSFETALADIIDNSIGNFASRIDVNFATGENPYVAIIDDGQGMDKETLENAMRYGSNSVLDEREAHDLGRFGLGLKMASMSQCRKLTVITKKNNITSAAIWDLDHIHKTKEWILKVYDQESAKALNLANLLTDRKSGTIVLWENLDKITESPLNFERDFNEKLNHASKHVSLVFHRFMENKKDKNYTEFYFNYLQLNPIDPFFLTHPATQKLEQRKIFLENRTPITVQPIITPYTSNLSVEQRNFLNENHDLNLKQGFYIYRNKRLIVWGKWFRIIRESELNRLAKVVIDLPNSIDHIWTIDVKKSSAEIPGDIKEQLKNIVKATVGKSERVYKYRGRKIKTDDFDHIWNKVENRGKFQYMINRELALYKALESSLDDNQAKLLGNFLSAVEDAFPYDSVYYDKATDVQFIEKSLETEEVYQTAKDAINQLLTYQSLSESIQAIKSIDIFNKYPEVIQKLEEEMSNE